MRHLNRSASRAAGAGLIGLLSFAALGWAQNNQFGGSQPTVEPTIDTFAGPPQTEGTASSKTPEDAIRKWPEAARVTALAMIAKYGRPTRYSKDALVWIDNGPWEKTVVYRGAWPHFVGRKNKDYLEQTIAYRVPAGKIDELKRFDRRLEVNESRSQLSARSESEPMNFLALNLAHEIVMDRSSVEDARDFYVKTERLSKAGKSSRYMDGLLFPSRVRDLGPASPDYDRDIEP
jgi:hypothetical protein